jgi:hypothetical protein
MIKRILKVIMFAICFLLLGLACLTVPIRAVYVLIKYVITGKEDIEFITIAVDRVLNININFIDELW